MAQQIPDHHGGELGLDQVEDPASFGARGVGEVAGVQGAQVIGPQVRFRLGPAIAAEAQRGLVAQDGVALEGRFQEQIPYYSGRELLLHQVEDVPALCARRADEVAGVCGRLVQEASDGVVDLGLRSAAGPVLQEGGRELAVQHRAGVVGQQLVGHVALHRGSCAVGQQLAGHVALRLGLRVVVAQIHRARRGVGDGLIRFGPRVEVEQRGDDLAIDRLLSS